MAHRRFWLSLALALALLPRPVLSARAAETADYDGYIVKLAPEAGVLFSAEDLPGGIFVIDSLDELQDVPEELVEYVEPNYLVELYTLEDPGLSEDAGNAGTGVPNDPYYEEYQWSLRDIHAEQLFARGLTGAGVTVGIVDSGVNRDHEDLNGSAISGENFHEDGAPYTQDDVGHGTFVTGILAAQTNNGIGLAGIAPGVSIRMYRAFNAKTAPVSTVAAAIRRAVADGCQVLNLSLGVKSDSVTLRDTVAAAVDAGVVVTAAAGNDGNTADGNSLRYPAAYPGVIGVGAVKQGFIVSDISQRNESVDFTAPGEGMAGLSHADPHGYRLPATASSNRGTSYASPIVTGLAALAIGYDHSITPEGVFALLRASAIDRGDPGYDTDYGCGVVDAARFLQAMTQSYTLDLQLNDGTLTEDGTAALPGTYKVYSEAIPLPVPTRAGYTFTGWYENENCTGRRIQEISMGSAGDRTLYAGWMEEARFPAAVYLASYRDSGQLLSIERIPEADWYDLSLPADTDRTRRVFALDSLSRPTTLPWLAG